MREKMMHSLQQLLEQWTINQNTPILDGAEDVATLLEHKFYVFINDFKEWFAALKTFPSLESALAHADIQAVVEKLPAPLYLPFENELDLLVDGITQENDEKYD